MCKKYLLSAAAVAVLAGIAPANAQTDSVSVDTADQVLRPFFGDIDPFRGDIDPFKGDIDPFAGDISPFRGDIDPFYGDISPFWGDIDPFWGDIDPFSGDIDPFSGDISPFWGDIDPFGTGGAAIAGLSDYWASAGPAWGSLNDTWNALDANTAADSVSWSTLANDLDTFVADAAATWGAAVTAGTNLTFEQAFADPLFAEYGINPDDPNSLANIDPATRSEFFLDWYDSLSWYSGTDIVDHWMATINWTPALTQDQGYGWDAVIGLLDVKISSTDDNVEYLINVGGYNASVNEHGAAVASLIAARHDGEGVMGIAPDAIVYAYNPFDHTGSSNFADIEHGVETLTGIGANVINMSLGKPNYTFHNQMADIFDQASLQAHVSDTVFVIASGNEGKEQKSNVRMSVGSSIENILFVGSVSPNKVISSFSNTPGESCVIFGNGNNCQEQNKLKYQFVVAPGELILVSDNAGGTTRLSGTSFAAPLVTGTVALIHDRWPWLQLHAEETVDIILQTAEDLGDPGVDGTYGYGLIDAEAAQAPLNFDNLVIFEPNSNGGFSMQTPQQLRNAVLSPGQLDLWEVEGAAIFAIENIGDTYRDFSIPLSTTLFGQSGTFNGNTERYQRHNYQRLVDWANTGSSFIGEEQTSDATIGAGQSWNLTMYASPVSTLAPASQQDRPYNPSFKLTNKEGDFAIAGGQGYGAMMLTHGDGFTEYSDYDPRNGGVNPFLGLASGGMFAQVMSEVQPGLQLSMGFTQVEDDNTYANEYSGERLRDLEALSDYQANAIFADVTYAVSDDVRLNASITHLEEQTGLLGAQGTGVLNLDEGSSSNAVTLGASYDVHPKVSLSGSVTGGRTFSNSASSAVIAVANDGLTSTAFELAANASSVITKNDRMRLTFAQPMHIEAGALEYQSVQVVDRVTGELGLVSERWGLGGGERHLITEAQYAFPVLEGAGEVSLFGRMDVSDTDLAGDFDAYAGGVRFGLKF